MYIQTICIYGSTDIYRRKIQNIFVSIDIICQKHKMYTGKKSVCIYTHQVCIYIYI